MRKPGGKNTTEVFECNDQALAGAATKRLTVRHRNGFVPLYSAIGEQAWNVRRCACGSLRDFRAKTCRACFILQAAEKLCNGCSLMLPAAAFYRRKNGDFVPHCKTCVNARTRARSPETKARYQAKTLSRPGHYKKVAARITHRRRTDINFKIADHQKNTLRQGLKRYNGEKSKSSITYLGCSIAEFREYIERQWQPGMNWSNWGRSKTCWHIDHIRPLSSFDFGRPGDPEACFHFTNMQPLWALDNIAKRDHWSPEGGSVAGTTP